MINPYTSIHITNNWKYYEDLGYEIPRRWTKPKAGKPRLVIDQTKKILIKVEDLPQNSCVKIEVTCDDCGKVNYPVYQSFLKYARWNNRDRCSKCAKSLNAKTSIAQKGSAHHNWNPNLTTIEREKIKEHRYHEDSKITRWRKAVYARDNYICQSCNIYAEKLNAHHLNCWSLFKDQRYDLENGITLCNPCHKVFHKQYGKKTTKEHWQEYIQKKIKSINIY